MATSPAHMEAIFSAPPSSAPTAVEATLSSSRASPSSSADLSHTLPLLSISQSQPTNPSQPGHAAEAEVKGPAADSSGHDALFSQLAHAQVAQDSEDEEKGDEQKTNGKKRRKKPSPSFIPTSASSPVPPSLPSPPREQFVPKTDRSDVSLDNRRLFPAFADFPLSHLPNADWYTVYQGTRYPKIHSAFVAHIDHILPSPAHPICVTRDRDHRKVPVLFHPPPGVHLDHSRLTPGATLVIRYAEQTEMAGVGWGVHCQEPQFALVLPIPLEGLIELDRQRANRPLVHARVGLRCRVCGDTSGKVKKCGRCGMVEYCSRECQKGDWVRHKSAECVLFEAVGEIHENLRHGVAAEEVQVECSACGQEKCEHVGRVDTYRVGFVNNLIKEG